MWVDVSNRVSSISNPTVVIFVFLRYLIALRISDLVIGVHYTLDFIRMDV